MVVVKNISPVDIFHGRLPLYFNFIFLYKNTVQPFSYNLPSLYKLYNFLYIYIYIYIYISGGPLSALTCCVNVRLLSAIKKISPLIYSQS